MGVNYEGGVLANPARVAIHLTHRIGALIATLTLTLAALTVITRKVLAKFALPAYAVLAASGLAADHRDFHGSAGISARACHRTHGRSGAVVAVGFGIVTWRRGYSTQPFLLIVSARHLTRGDVTMAAGQVLQQIIAKSQKELLAEWLQNQLSSDNARSDLMKESELREQCREFLALLQDAARSGGLENLDGSAWTPVREFLAGISRSRAMQGFSPAETATFVFSLKQPLFTRLRREITNDAQALADEFWAASVLIDKLGLYTMEMFQKSREEVISRQQQELLELSTPVVSLWKDILALPLIGTLDSARTQVVMESLLQKIVETGAAIAIIDITGVPTVDTLVAQHLLKTVAAARLMGADCIISGIRPQIAQTIVHLGVDLSAVTTKATLADAFLVALRRTQSSLPKPVSG